MDVFGEYQKEIETMYNVIKPLVVKSLEIYNDLHEDEKKMKNDGSVVSIYDFAFQMMIIHEIKKVFPNDKFLGEEDITTINSDFLSKISAIFPKDFNTEEAIAEMKKTIKYIKEDDHRVWVIDPIDGTQGFVTHRDFSIASALLVDLETVLCVTAWPCHDNKKTGLPFNGPGIFCCAKNKGAFALDMEGHIYPIKLPPNPKNGLLFSDANGKINERYLKFKEENKIEIEIPIISMAKAFVLATGNAIVFPKSHHGEKIHVYDVAPFELFLREAGCQSTTVNGGPILCDRNGIIVDSEVGLMFSAYDHAKHLEVCKIFKGLRSK